jgi:hypothetical protein
MFGEECFCKVNKVSDNIIVPISPERSKFKTVRSFFAALSAGTIIFFDMA